MNKFRSNEEKRWQTFDAEVPREGVCIGLSNDREQPIMVAVNYVDVTTDSIESTSTYLTAVEAYRMARGLNELAEALQREGPRTTPIYKSTPVVAPAPITYATMAVNQFLSVDVNGEHVAEIFRVDTGQWVIDTPPRGPYMGNILQMEDGSFRAVNHMGDVGAFPTFNRALFFLCSTAGDWTGWKERHGFKRGDFQ